MKYATIEQELDELLNEDPERARQRAASQFDPADDVPIVLYGAGNLGQTVLQRLRKTPIVPVAFADDTPAKQGTTIDQLPVLSPMKAVERWGPRTIFVVTIFTPQASFERIAQRLRATTGARVVSFLNLAWKFPEYFLPHYYLELPQQVLSKSAEIRRSFNLFADEESRRQFLGHLRFRLWLDFAALPASNKGDYFPSDVIGPLPAQTAFVDCGAYDGDTIRAFLAHQTNEFGSIYAFEPDAINFRRLRDFVTTLDAGMQTKVHLYQAGVGARRERLPFAATGGMGAAFAAGGEVEVDVLPIDEVITRGAPPIYLKFDVEGTERQALAGARQLISSTHPVIAVSVYHQPDDLWQLPPLLADLQPDYRLFLRTQGEDGMDVICYAVPPERLPQSQIDHQPS